MKSIPSLPSQPLTCTILELGAGTGLAACVCALKASIIPSSTYHIYLQELPEIIDKILPTLHTLLPNHQPPIQGIGGKWGSELASLLLSKEPTGFDIILFADCLYHEEDFQDLLTTIISILKADGSSQVIFVVEQRRKDLTGFFILLATYFQSISIWIYEVQGKDITMKEEEDTGDGIEIGNVNKENRCNQYYICRCADYSLR
jgi:SAM-dependent methyltransferase